MINALRTNNRASVTAEWFPEHGNRYTRKVIKVEIISEVRREYAQPVQNLMTDKSSARVSTEYNYAYKQSDELYMLDGWWTIVSVGFNYQMDKTDAVSLVKPKYGNTQTVIEVVRKA